MASTTFVNNVTLTDAAWFNDVNTLVYILAGDGTNAPTTDQLVRTNLSINNLTEDTAPDPAADYIETYDASAGTAKKVLVSRIGGLTSMGLVASTSGTSIDFTGIPSGAKRITIMLQGVSTSGTSNLRFQLGDAGGVETTGYLGSSSAIIVSSCSTILFTSGFDINDGFSAASIRHGFVVLSLVDSATFTWSLSGCLSHSDVARTFPVAGTKATSQALDRVRITTVNGTDTFDAGSIQVIYE